MSPCKFTGPRTETLTALADKVFNAKIKLSKAFRVG